MLKNVKDRRSSLIFFFDVENSKDHLQMQSISIETNKIMWNNLTHIWLTSIFIESMTL